MSSNDSLNAIMIIMSANNTAVSADSRESIMTCQTSPSNPPDSVRRAGGVSLHYKETPDPVIITQVMSLSDIKAPLSVFTENKSCSENETMMVELEGGATPFPMNATSSRCRHCIIISS